MKISTRYFPFSPGIGWKIKNGKYIIPEINLDVWNKVTANKDITVVAFGGLIESYLSLCYLEMLNYIIPGNTLYWCGDARFDSMAILNGIAIPEQTVPKPILSKYPAPIFLDANKNVYFNCLNNYLTVKPYYGGKGYLDKTPIAKQLLRNSTMPWDNQYIPKFRKLAIPASLLQWSKIVKFDVNKPFVCLFQRLGWSNHKASALGWNEVQIKALSSMLRQRGISTIIFTHNPGKFYGSSAYCLTPSMEHILYAIHKAKAILSEEVDFLLLAMMSSNAKVIMKKVSKHLSPIQNSRYLGIHKSIFVGKRWSPPEVFDIIDSNGKF